MYRFLLSRLAATIPVLLGVSFLVFMMLHLVPGDPVKMMLSEFQTSPQQVQLLPDAQHEYMPVLAQKQHSGWPVALQQMLPHWISCVGSQDEPVPPLVPPPPPVGGGFAL